MKPLKWQTRRLLAAAVFLATLVVAIQNGDTRIAGLSGLMSGALLSGWARNTGFARAMRKQMRAAGLHDPNDP